MSSFTDDRRSRRALLRAGTAALTAGLTALSGCSGLPPLGSKVRYGTVPVPGARAPGYREWLPAPDALPGAAAADYDVLAYEPPPDDAPAWTRGSVQRTLVVSQSDYVGVYVDDVDVAIGISGVFESGSAVVLAGDVDVAAVRETIAATSYEADGATGGYDVYARPEADRTLGVSTDGLVFGNGPNARDIVASIATTRGGDSRRYHEASAEFEALSDEVGSRRWTWLMPGTKRSGDRRAADTGFRNTVGRAVAFSHDDDTAYSVRTWLFPEGEAPTAGEVKTAFERQPRADEADAVEVTVDGRVATTKLSRPVAKYREVTPTLVAPYVAWRTEYDAAADTLCFHHEVGDTVETDRLLVRADGIDDVTDFDVGSTVESGEAVTVSTADVESGTPVRLVYESPNGDATAALADRELP